MRVRHPGGTEVFIRVGPRDLSENGMAFLNGGYLHVGTVVEFLLRLRSGEPIQIEATVVRCEHVYGRVHDVGLRFATAVEMSEVADVEVEPSAPVSAKPLSKAVGARA